MRLFLLTLSFVTLSGCLHGGAPVVPDSDGGAAPELDSSSLVDLTVAEAGVVTVATFNVRRYFDMICHSGQCGGADDFELQLSPEAFEARTQQVAAAIDALPDTLPDEIRLPVVIEGKALRLVDLQRRVRCKIANEARVADACRDPDALLDTRPARMPADPNTYVASISRHAAARMQQMHSRMRQDAELKRQRELHARVVIARQREEKRRMEAERRAQVEASRKQRLAMAIARKMEIEARVAVVRRGTSGRRAWGRVGANGARSGGSCLGTQAVYCADPRAVGRALGPISTRHRRRSFSSTSSGSVTWVARGHGDRLVWAGIQSRWAFFFKSAGT